MGSETEKPLQGWKEIAKHLDCSVKTAQRREADGMPVHRHERLGVFAYPSELDSWRSSLLKEPPRTAPAAVVAEPAQRPGGLLLRRYYWPVASAILGVSVLALLALFLGSWDARRGIPTVAVLEFRSISNIPDEEWLSTALAELYRAELGANGKLRIVTGEAVTRMKRELALPEVDTFSKPTLERIRRNSGADWVASGTYLASGGAEQPLRIQIAVQDTRTGDTLAVDTETGSETTVSDLVSRSGGILRAKLSLGKLSDGQLLAGRNALPRNLDAQRLYAEGLRQLRLFDVKSAVDVLGKAVRLEPGYALAHAALAEAWQKLGYEQRAADEARLANETAGALGPEEALSIEGTYDELANRWDHAISNYRRLRSFAPSNGEYALRLARAQIRSGKGTDALGTLAEIEERFPSDRSRILVLRALAAESLGDFKLEKSEAQEAARLAGFQGAPLLRAEALLRHCWAAYSLSEYSEALAKAQEAHQIFDEMKHHTGKAHALKNIADILDDQGKHALARQHYEEALRIFKDIGDQAGVAATLNNLAYVLLDEGDLLGAKKLFGDSVDVSRQIADRGREALGLNGVGIALWRQGDLPGARRFFEESLSIHRDRRDRSRQATLLNNIGLVFEDEGQLEAALAQFEQSLRLLRDIPDQSGIARNLGNIGQVLLEKGELTAARKSFDQQLTLGRAIHQRKQEAYALQGLGEVCLVEGNFKAARVHLERARDLRFDMGEKGLAAESQLVLAEVALEEQRPSAAFDTAQQAAIQFLKENERPLAAQAYVVMAQARLAQKDLMAADQAVEAATRLAAESFERLVQVQLALSRGRIAAAGGRTREARHVLENVLASSTRHQYLRYALEARLALAELVRKTESSRTTAELAVIEREATTKGMGLIASKIRKAK